MDLENFDAKEARRISDNVKSFTNNAQYVDVIKAIKKQVESKDSKNNIYWYESIRPDVEEELTRKGFTIETNNHQNETTIIISW
jgi:hypothetical protein